MPTILTLLFFIFSFSTFAQFSNQYPAKKEATITFKFGTPILDNYKWMENYSDADLYIWRDQQNTQAKRYIGDSGLQHYAEVQDKLKSFQNEMREKSKALNSEAKKEASKEFTSSIYEVSYQDVEETGGRYGSLQRVLIKDKLSGEIKETHLGFYFQVLKWLDDETYVYTNYKTERLRLGFAPYAAIHKVGTSITDDKILLTAKSGDFFDFHKSKGKMYVNHFDGFARDINVSLFNTSTGELTNTIKFGTKMQYIGEDHENDNYFHYITEYKEKNYGEIIKVNIETGERISIFSPQDFVPQSLTLVDSDTYLLLAYKDGESLIGTLNRGKFSKIAMPGGGQIRVKSVRDGVASLAWQSYSNILLEYEYDFDSKLLNKVGEHVYPTKIETKKIHYTAPNGEKAFIWISKKPETQLNANTPLILYGYGGWYHSELPTFNRAESLGWIEKGGVFAVAAIPGSLAYGMKWNQIAKAHNRVKSFDSMANAARELIKRNYTSSEHIGIFGASNGGLLVAGTFIKYPDLFKAAVPAVGVYNLIDCSAKGVEWELGNPCLRQDFFRLKKISPLHNIEKVKYPSVLVMTADQDSITKPTDSYKLVAKLQEKSSSDNPILVYTKIGGGHSMSSGSPTEKLNYIAYLYSFFEKELGLNRVK